MGLGHLTILERNIIEELVRKSICVSHIGKRLGRDGSVVAKEIKRCGGRENYTAEKGQKVAMEAMRKKQEIRSINKQNSLNSLVKRVTLAHDPFEIYGRIRRIEDLMDNIKSELRGLYDEFRSTNSTVTFHN